jgi:hypothetical protein
MASGRTTPLQTAIASHLFLKNPPQSPFFKGGSKSKLLQYRHPF